MLLRNHIEPNAGSLLRLKQMGEAAERASSLEQLLGIEGNAVLYLSERINDLGVECSHFADGAGLAYEAWEKGLLGADQATRGGAATRHAIRAGTAPVVAERTSRPARHRPI